MDISHHNPYINKRDSLNKMNCLKTKELNKDSLLLKNRDVKNNYNHWLWIKW